MLVMSPDALKAGTAAPFYLATADLMAEYAADPRDDRLVPAPRHRGAPARCR